MWQLRPVWLGTGHLKYGYTHGLEYIFYYRYGLFDVLGTGLPLCLVFGICLVAECRAGRVESHSDVGWFLLCHHFVDSIDKSHHCRGVEPF